MDETHGPLRFIPNERRQLDDFQRELIELLPRLRRLARSLCRNATDADDLVQTAVERALSRRHQWTPGTRLDWWIMRIMRNAFIDDARKSGRAVLAEPEELAARADPTMAGDDLKTEAMAVDQAMKRLPPEQRMAIALVLIEGLTYAEAAELVGTPPGTLASRLARGRDALIADLEGASP